jgi:hypothetical protein
MNKSKPRSPALGSAYSGLMGITEFASGINIGEEPEKCTSARTELSAVGELSLNCSIFFRTYGSQRPFFCIYVPIFLRLLPLEPLSHARSILLLRRI